MRKEYEMTQAQLDGILAACKPVTYMVFGGMEPQSTQENANDAWAALGQEMGFDHMTVRPNGKGDRFFSADSLGITQEKVMSDIGNPIAEQLRQNADMLLGPGYRTGQIPDAAIAGALQMGAQEIERLQKELVQWTGKTAGFQPEIL